MESLEVSLTYLKSPLALSLTVLAAAATALLSYLRFFRGGHRKLICFLCFLRFIGILTALLILLRPVLHYRRVVKQERRVAVLADTSKSMAITDSVRGESRVETAENVCKGAPIKKLQEAFVVERLSFAGSVKPFASPMVARGERTNISGALREVASGAVPLACTVVLSDGCHSGDLEKHSYPSPVWCVPLGSGHGLWNLSVREIEADSEVLIGNRTQVEAIVSISGSPPQGPLKAVLTIENRETGSKPIPSKAGTHRVVFPVTPGKAALLRGKVTVKSNPAEAFTDDNRRTFFLEVLKERLKILVYEPSPRWESKFILRSLRTDKNLRVAGVLRTASDQFYVEGDPPVPLKGGLPSNRKDFDVFSAIVLGDVTSRDLLTEQIPQLLSYVREGGGLIIAAGRSNLSGSLAQRSLSPLLPAVAVGPRKRGKFFLSGKTPRHPVLRGLGVLFNRSSQTGSFHVNGVIPLGEVRPGARVLVEAEDSKTAETYPFLVVQRYGKGRVGIVGSSSTWTWAMRNRIYGEKAFHERFWGQLARWTSRRTERREETLILSGRLFNAGERVKISLIGSKEEKASVAISGPGEDKRLVLTGSSQVKEAFFIPNAPGDYLVKYKTKGVQCEKAFVVHPNPAERDALQPDEDALYEITEKSGGGLVRLHEISELPSRILHSFPGAIEEVERPPEKNPLLFIIFISAVCLEWFLRRRILTV